MAHTMAKSSFSEMVYFSSALFRVLEMNKQGCPSWLSTAPNPWFDTSVVNMNCFEKSGNFRTGAVIKAFFKSILKRSSNQKEYGFFLC